MEHDLVIEGKVVRLSGVEELQVGVSDGKIAEVRRQGVKGARKIQAGRCLVFPGFVDVHVHLREPGWEHKEDFRTGTRAAVHGGVTTVVDMPNNPVPSTTRAAIEEKKRLAAKGSIDVKFYGGVEAEHLDRLEGLAGLVVGYKVFLARSSGDLLFPEESLEEAFRVTGRLGLPMSLHCEKQSVIDKRARDLAGVDRPDVYCDIRPPEAEVESVASVLKALSLEPGSKASVCHASTEGALRLVTDARGRGLSLDCEAALHHLFFNRRAMLGDPRLKTNPPLRGEGDRAAMVKGLRDGQVSFLVTDHAPHTLEEKKEKGLSGVPGLDDYSHLVSWLVKKEQVDPVAIMWAASSKPAGYAGLKDRGEVAVGTLANFSILDLDSPETVGSDDIESKCGWSPYEGTTFPGRARWTIREGEALLDDFELAV